MPIPALIDSAGEITHVQVAVDGVWENATRVSRAEGADAVSKLTAALRPRGELAIEVFAVGASGSQTFLGVRLRDVGKENATFLLRALLEVVATESVTLSDVTTWLAARTGTALFAGELTRIEIGVVDSWLSLGARDITTALSTHQPDRRATVVHAADALRAPAGRVIELEFAFDAPTAHWVGVEVARSTPGGVVASESINRAIDALARSA